MEKSVFGATVSETRQDRAKVTIYSFTAYMKSRYRLLQKIMTLHEWPLGVFEILCMVLSAPHNWLCVHDWRVLHFLSRRLSVHMSTATKSFKRNRLHTQHRSKFALTARGFPSSARLSCFYQRVSIASYASAGIARAEMSVRPSVRPSVTLRYCIKTKTASVMIFSPSESPNILVSGNMWIITKIERGHPARGRYMRLG